MNESYRILLTDDSFKGLRSTEVPYYGVVSKFIEHLMTGEWEKNESIRVWKKEDRILFSLRIDGNLYTVWEALWSINLTTKVHHNFDEFTPHILLHYLGQTFPGEPEKWIKLGNDKFEPAGALKPEHLVFRERRLTDELKYDRELYFLPRRLIGKVLSGDQKGLLLQMPKEEIEVLLRQRTLRGPVLLQGEAGSGKTSLVTLWLLLGELENVGSQLFVTLSDLLVERTQDEFESMLPTGYGSHHARFETYRDVLQRIYRLGESLLSLPPKNPLIEMTFRRFTMEFKMRISSTKVDLVLLWDEIRSVIKGGCLDPTKRMLDLKEYEKLSEERGQCKVPRDLRKEYYQEAQKYQNYLDQEGLWDAIDLARDCLRLVEKADKYGRIACDEVQDLSPIEILVLTKLVKGRNTDSMFFAGDVGQVINPSGFTWEKLKGMLGEVSKRRDIRDPEVLWRNFRSTSEIVDLVNEVLLIKRDILGDGGIKKIEHSGVYIGTKPLILNFSPLDEITELESNPNTRAILVKRPDIKKELIKQLGKTAERITVLTVEEAKGLDWDVVLLWNFFLPRHEITKDIWEAVFIPQKRTALKDNIKKGKGNPYALAYEFNLLHVGLTRPKTCLFVYDEREAGKLLNLGEEIGELVGITSDRDEFSINWKTTPPTPEDFEETGKKLMDGQRDPDRACVYFGKAGDGYRAKRNFEKAAECYKKGLDYDLAAKCYEEIKEYARAEEMRALDAGVKEDYISMAGHWSRHLTLLEKKGEWRTFLDHYDFVSSAYQKAGKNQEAARSLEDVARRIPPEKREDFLVAKAIAFRKAADLWGETGQNKKAIDALNQAIDVWEDIIIHEIRVSNRERTAADLRVKLSELYEKVGKISDAAQARKVAASRYLEAGDEDSYHWSQVEAADLYERVGLINEAMDLRREDFAWLLENWTNESQIESEHRKLVMLLRKTERAPEHAEVTKSYMAWYKRRGDTEGGIKKAEETISWCENNGFYGCAVDLLGVAKGWAEESRNYELLGETEDRIGENKGQVGEWENVKVSFLAAGRAYLKVGLLDSALKSFKKGEEAIKPEMRLSAVGLYCLKDVALESLVPEYNGLSERWGYMKNAVGWINKATGYLVDDYGKSVKQVENYIRQCEHALKGSPMERQSEIGRKCGWAYYCLAELHLKVGKDRPREEALGKAKEHSGNELESFLKI